MNQTRSCWYDSGGSISSGRTGTVGRPAVARRRRRCSSSAARASRVVDAVIDAPSAGGELPFDLVVAELVQLRGQQPFHLGGQLGHGGVREQAADLEVDLDLLAHTHHRPARRAASGRPGRRNCGVRRLGEAEDLRPARADVGHAPRPLAAGPYGGRSGAAPAGPDPARITRRSEAERTPAAPTPPVRIGQAGAQGLDARYGSTPPRRPGERRRSGCGAGLCPGLHLQGQVEQGHAASRLDGGHREPGDVQGVQRRVLEREQGLRQGGPPDRRGGSESSTRRSKRHLLVGEASATAVRRRAITWRRLGSPAEIGPQDQRIDEKPISPSVSSRARPATGVAKARSSCSARRPRKAAKTAAQATKGVPPAGASSRSRSVRPPAGPRRLHRMGGGGGRASGPAPAPAGAGRRDAAARSRDPRPARRRPGAPLPGRVVRVLEGEQRATADRP